MNCLKRSPNYVILFLGLTLVGVAQTFSQTGEFPPTIRSESLREVSGTIQSETTSRPLSGIKVYLTAGGGIYQVNQRSYTDITDPVVTGLDGKYKIVVEEGHRLLFIGSGFAPRNLAIPEGSELNVKLGAGRTLSGTLLMPSGEPAAGATVFPAQWVIPHEKPLETQGSKRGFYRHNSWGALPEYGKPLAVKADQDGNFSIKNMPDYLCGIVIQKPEAKEKLVYIKTDQGTPVKNLKGKKVENESVIELEQNSVLKVDAVDSETGVPAKIANVFIEPNPVPNSLRGMSRIYRTTKPINDEKATVSIGPYPHGCKVYVEPENKQLLGIYFELPPIKADEEFEKSIEFPPGFLVKGAVVSENGEPISGVKLAWRRIKGMKEFCEDGTFPVTEFETDSDGKFEVGIPDVDGIIGMTKKVPGHITATSWEDIATYKRVAPEVLERHTRQLKQGEIGNEELNFELPANSQLKINVVDESGESVSNGIVSFDRIMVTSTNSWRTKHINKMTDESGQVTVDDWYEDAFELAKARKILEKATEDNAGQNNGSQRFSPHIRLRSHYPTKIQAYTDEGVRQGTVAVPLPADEAETNIIEVTIPLLAGGDVVGQVIDLDDKPVAGLKVKASLLRGGGQTWKTETRDDGWFKMVGLPEGAKPDWDLDSKRVKTVKSDGRIDLDLSLLKAGQTLEVDPIVCIDYKELADPLPELEIGGLSNEAAFKLLAAYIEDCKSLVPKEHWVGYAWDQPEKLRRFFSSRSSGNPIPSFRKRMVKKILPVIKKMADRDPGSEFELKLLMYVDGSIAQNQPLGVRELEQFCFKRLMDRHLKNEKAQKPIVRLANRASALKNRSKTWEAIRDGSPFDETKTVASIRIVMQRLNSCRNAVGDKTGDKEFKEEAESLESSLDQLKKIDPEILAKSKNELRLMARNRSTFGMMLRPEVWISSHMGQIDKSRVEEILKVLDGGLKDLGLEP